MDVLPIAQGVLLAPAVGLGVYWSVVLTHLVRTAQGLPTARHGLKLARASEIISKPETAPSVCIVIPAHNEAENVRALIESLKAQNYPRFHVVMCLDRCTDDTKNVLDAAIAGDKRFTVLTISECPSDWAGKVHAIWRGVQDAPAAKAADMLLFIDADTAMHPDVLRSTVALLEERRVGLLSLLSTMKHEQWFENVVQPAAGLELMRQYPMLRANLDKGRRAFANGQFILVTKATYNRIGGHESVRHAVLEDIELARVCERENVRVAMLMADGMHICGMYADYEEFVKGWRRIFIEGANRRPARLRKLAFRSRAIGSVMPVVAVAALGLGIFGMATRGDALSLLLTAFSTLSLGIMIFALTQMYRMGHTKTRHIWAYPIGAWMTADILVRSAKDLETNTPTEWAGRTYTREAR